MQQIDKGRVADSLGRRLVWKKSRHSNPSGNCVEVAEAPDGGVAVRNSRHPEGPVLLYTRAEMTAFVNGVKDGEFDEFTHAPATF